MDRSAFFCKIILTWPASVLASVGDSGRAVARRTLGGLFMRVRNIAIFSAAVLAGALGGSLVGPRPAEAVARELVELQHHVPSLPQGQKDLSTQMTPDHTLCKPP